MKIAVMEDEIRIREGIIRLLGKLYSSCEIVGEAGNGADGLKVIEAEKPDIIITDIRMTPVDGLEMLEQAYQKGCRAKAIVISAYSEFEYARKAMHMGVTEYLTKPVTLGAFSQAMKNVCRQMEQERMAAPEQVGGISQILKGILLGSMKPDGELEEYLRERCKIAGDQKFAVVCTYLGTDYEREKKRVKRKLEFLWEERKEGNFCCIELEYQKAIVSILYHYSSEQQIRRWLQNRLAEKEFQNMGFGWVETDGLLRLRDDFESLYAYIDWNIALDEQIVIVYPQIKSIQTVPCIYPLDLESRVKAAICSGDIQKVQKVFEKFSVHFRNGKVYAPKETKECYVRFLWAVIGIAKEMGCLDTEKLNQAELLEQIMDAKLNGELQAALDCVREHMLMKSREDNVTHLTVKRAKGMIHEYYQTGITLEEIAAKLNVTPEYLGTQFRREVGVNFSSYIRSCRMDRAKELLCRTQLKLYEISEKVGYTNPKYFSQVFKEYTGFLPAEYRKMYR